MKEKICKKCDGEGYIMNRGSQFAAGIISMGIFPLIDAAMSRSKKDSEFSYKCKICNGEGKVYCEGQKR